VHSELLTYSKAIIHKSVDDRIYRCVGNGEEMRRDIEQLKKNRLIAKTLIICSLIAEKIQT
jgi:uncharacterized protein YdcH (DUF465 family)